MSGEALKESRPSDQATLTIELQAPLPDSVAAFLEGKDTRSYLGIYEGEGGEYLIFIRRSSCTEGEVYHGGQGWRRLKVVDGVVAQPVLSTPARAWLAACWVSSNLQRSQLAAVTT